MCLAWRYPAVCAWKIWGTLRIQLDMKPSTEIYSSLRRGVEQWLARRARFREVSEVNTKLKGDIAEQAAILHAMKHGWRVL